MLKDHIKNIVQFISKRQKVVIKGEVVLSQKQHDQIRELYKKSNIRTTKLLSINLGKLGYAVEDP